MAKPVPPSEKRDGSGQPPPKDVCGIVMPISSTPNHGETHWGRVQSLLHRVVKDAGLEPKNVWSGEATDRITERILSNLFDVPIAVCDVSDLNPNVMLELGMRLTSRRPTIVIAESGSTIPFDIKDFEAIEYPPDLNIIEMEIFFERLKLQIQEKLAAWKGHLYRPFLNSVTIDVLEPQSRQVPFEELVTQQLEMIMARVEQLDSRTAWISRRAALYASASSPDSETQTKSEPAATGDLIFIDAARPDDRDRLAAFLSAHPDVVSWGHSASTLTYHVRLNKPLSPTKLTQIHADLRASGIPFAKVTK